MTDETIDELMGATYRALCKHGYASLRMQDIADESTKSKAALHYHYDSKHDLLLAFLEHLYEQFEDEVTETDDTDPTTELTTFIEQRLTPRDQDTHQEFQTAILEIKAQAPYDEAYCEQLAKFDRLMHDRIQTLIEEGIDQGVFKSDLNSDEIAEFFVTVINGAHTRHVAVDYSIENTRRMLLEYIDIHILADDTATGVVLE
ncbi:TetR/AcrR family transcriptional regulator [halophilic archaeon]|nr:TetR/AcrR family transcriptional regulator [halophilic archaeon]